MQHHEIVRQFEKKIKINKDYSKVFSVINVSNNHRFLGLQIKSNFYLVDNNGKTLLHLEAYLFTCCFSNDSKYTVVFFQKQGQYLLLYDLKKKKKKWVKQISYKSELLFEYIIGLEFQNLKEIIIFTYEAIQIIKLNGEIKTIIFLTNNSARLDICEKLIKLNDKILIFQDQQMNLDLQEQKIQKEYYQNKMHRLSKLLKIQYWNFLKNNDTELFQGKIIRKNKPKERSYEIRNRYIINNNLYLIGIHDTYNYVMEVSLITGYTKLLTFRYFVRNPLTNIRVKYPLYFVEVIKKEKNEEKERKNVIYHFLVQALEV